MPPWWWTEPEFSFEENNIGDEGGNPNIKDVREEHSLGRFLNILEEEFRFFRPIFLEEDQRRKYS